MGKRNALAAAAIAAWLAITYGQRAGIALYGVAEPNAWLKGAFAVACAGFLAAHVAINNVNFDRLVPVLFAGYMAYLFGQPAGYKWYFANNDLQAKIYGMGTVFMLALFPGMLFVGPMVGRVGNQLLARLDRTLDELPGLGFPASWGLPRFISLRPPAPPLSPTAIWEKIENGEELHYRGRIFRSFPYMDGRSKEAHLHQTFILTRDTLAMTPRERAAYYILVMLKRHGLDAQTADRMLFALTWGNGSCSASSEQRSANMTMLQWQGFKTNEDVIRNEAIHRGATTEGAISQLFTLLRRTATAPGASEELVALHRSFINPAAHPGQDHSQWS